MYIPRSILGYSHDWPAAAAGARVCRQMVSRCDRANWSASVRCPQALVYTGPLTSTRGLNCLHVQLDASVKT